MNYKPVSDHDYRFTRGELKRGERGTWGFLHSRETNEPIPTASCGDCGGNLMLDKNHTIADDGKITPSVGCVFCGWHVFGRLEGWGAP